MKRFIILGALGALLGFVVSCQKTPTAELSVSQNEYTVQASGGSVNVSVSSNVDLTVRISAGWITQAGGPSSGGGTYSFTVAHNDGYDARTATITFSNGEQGVSETVTVTQSQQDAIILGSLEYQLFYEAQTFSLPVSANVDYSVSVSGGDWIKSLGTRGLTTKQYQFSIAENTGKTPREAVVTITSGSLKQSIKVEQLPTTHFPETKEDWKESVKINKEISDSRLEIFKKLDQDGITDVYQKAEALKGIQGVVDVIVNSDGSVISVMQRDSVWLDILMINPVSVLDSESDRKSSSATIQSGSNVPTRSTDYRERGGALKTSKPTYVKQGGRALILSAFQWQFGYPVDEWYDILSKHFHVDSLLNSNVDIRYFTDEIPTYLQSKVDPFDEYDFILFATHGGFQFIQGGFFTTGENVNSFMTGTVVSEGTADLVAELNKKKFSVRTGSVNGSKTVYYEIIPSWFDDASFDNSAVVLAACHSAETKTMVNKLIDKGASFVSGNLGAMSCRAIHVYVDNLLTCMDNGLSFVEAHDYASKSYYAQLWVNYEQNEQTNEKDEEGNVVPMAEDMLSRWDTYTRTVCFPEKSDDGYYFISPFPELSAPQKGEYSLKWSCNLSPFTSSWLFFYDFKVNKKGERTIEGANTHNYDYSITYDIYINGKLHSSTKEKLISVADLPKGDYKAYVIAKIVVGEGNNVLYSYKSNEVSFESTGEVVKVTGVRVSPSTLTLEESQTSQLKATVYPNNATNKKVTWTSNYPENVSVDENGLVTAIKRKLGVSYVTITAKTEDGGQTSTCKVTVKESSSGKIAVTGISLDQTSTELKVGDVLQLNATVAPSNATNKTVTWSSNNNSVATVSSSGLVSAKAEGTAKITAKTEDGGKTASMTITVKKAGEGNVAVTGVSLDKSSMSLKVGESGTLKATVSPTNATNKGLTWTTSMSSVATVTSDGVVTAKAAGTATITVKTDDGGKTATCNVTVTYDPGPGGDISVSQVTISPTTANMTVGDTKQFSVKIDPANATNQEVSWSSSEPSIASVDSKGMVTAKAEGKATITVTAKDGGISSKATVTVSSKVVPVTGVTVSPTSLTMDIGDSKSLTVTVNPSDATDKTYTISSDNTGVVEIDKDNNVVAKGAGTANVTVTTTDGAQTATCKVTVNKPQMTIEAVDLGLSVKWANLNLGATSPEEYGDYYAWGETLPYYNSQSPLEWKSGKQSGYDWSSYNLCNGSNKTITKYCTNSNYGYNGFTDGKTTLVTEDDAAYVILGGKWRMPTKADQDELRDNCNWEWTTMNGIKGRKVTGPNGNSIFLPAAGYRFSTSLSYDGTSGAYWSSSLGPDESCYAYYLTFNSSAVSWQNSNRVGGLPIRPVYGDLVISVESVSLDKTELELSVGETASLVASVIPSNAANTSLTWSSSNESVVKVSSSGVLTGVSVGSATITVTSVSGGKKAACKVTVNKPQMTIEVSPTSLSFGDVNVGESSTKTFTISNTGKAEVKVSGISVSTAFSIDTSTPLTIAV